MDATEHGHQRRGTADRAPALHRDTATPTALRRGAGAAALRSTAAVALGPAGDVELRAARGRTGASAALVGHPAAGEHVVGLVSIGFGVQQSHVW